MKSSRKRKFAIAMLLASVMMVFGGITAYADSFMPPEPFEIWSDDGTMVFIWNPGAEDNWSQGTAQAGVYRDGELVYSVENLPIMGESENNFLFSSDFRHFVFRPTVGQVMALGFFEDGVLLRAYRIDELVRDMNVVTYSVTIAMWENWQGRDFDVANNTLTIVTRDDITYVFDITTGEIIYHTAGDTPFIPSAHPFILHGDEQIPLWAQNPNEETPSSWAQESIERADDLGLLPSPFSYGFGRSATRAEFAAIAVALYEHLREPITGRITFTDTTDTNVEKAAYLGIVTGIGDNRFDPNSPLTREQAAVMLSRLMDLFGMGIHELVPPNFSDANEISNWAITAVRHIQVSEIMGGVGDNRFSPQSPYTREQSVVTIMRVFDLVLRQPHPFATALREYFMGCAGDMGQDVRTAVFVDADGAGTLGVLATRSEYFPFGRVFYIYDGELFYKDVGPQDAGFVTGVTAEGRRMVNLMGDGGQWSFTLFGIENGRLTETFTIFGETIDGINNAYYYFPRGLYNWENRQSITQEEFNAIRTRYGLDNTSAWWARDDESVEILAMTTK